MKNYKLLKKKLASLAVSAAMLLSSVPFVYAQDPASSSEISSVTISESEIALENSYNVIENKATGRVISVENGGTDNMNPVTVESLGVDSALRANTSKIWRLVPISDNLFYIMNKKSGRSLDVPDARTEDGVQLIQYTYFGNTQQKMLFEKDGDAYTISPSHADTYLADVDGKLVQISDKTAENAKWVLKTVSGSLMELAKQSEGYKLLDESLQRAFDTYFFSELDLSKSVLNSAETLLSSSNYPELSPEEQKRILTTALTYTASGQVEGYVTNETVAPYKIVSQEQVEDFDIWRGSRCTAWVFQVEMEGDVEGQVHSFQFATNEEEPDAEMITKSIEAIGVFPYAMRQHVKYLYWKKGDTANSFNGGGNSIWIRLTWEPSRESISQTLSHELGHVLEQNMLNDPDVWSLAERLDACPISSYGSSNETEDLAEFSRLYWTNLGRDTFSELEKVYPNRMKIFKGLLYRADKEYFKEYEEYEAYIDELTARSRAAGSDSDNSGLSEEKIYKIVDTRTDKVLTVKDNSTENDIPLTMERYTAKAGQHFRIEKYGNQIKIISASSSKPIQLDDSALGGKSIVQYGGVWAIDEKFAVYETENGTFKLMAPRYELYISPLGDAASQSVEPYEWTFVEVGESDTKTGKLMINGSALSVNTGATLALGGDTVWKIAGAEEPGCYKIIDTETGLSLDVTDSSVETGTEIIVYDFYGNDNQLFLIENGSDGFRIRNKNSGLYLTVNADGKVTQEIKGENQIFTIGE